MKFLDQVLSLIRTIGSLEDLGRGLARILDQGHLQGFIFYGAQERCLLTIPYCPAGTNERLKENFERSDWRSRPREAFLSTFAELEIPTGEIGEGVQWAFLGPEENPLGAFACVPDPAAPLPTDTERKSMDFFFRLAGELAMLKPKGESLEGNAREREYLLEAMNQIGQLMLDRQGLH